MPGDLMGAANGALWGAISAGAAFGVGHGNMFSSIRSAGAVPKAILHGLSRTAISKLQYGSGKGSFLSGFASSLLGGGLAKLETSGDIGGKILKVTMAAIAGGTASAIGGGKFANGAMSGAFIMLFNDLVLENTSAEVINGMHRRISVYSKDGKRLYGISFGQNRGSDELFGFDNFEPKFNQNGGGIVYEDITDSGTIIVKTLSTTPAQDTQIIQYMKFQLGKTASYNLILNSCRNYASREYDYLKKHIGGSK